MPRVRDFLLLGTLPAGEHCSITDVARVRVGHAWLDGDGLHTGVTAVLPHDGNLYQSKVTAAAAILNGYGKSAGLMQVEELGTVETPILITSTLNVPRAADALITYMLDQDPAIGSLETVNPVVLECFDGYLSDAKARPVGEAMVREAISQARGGAVEVGCVGAGVGMRCQGFKSGVGTASRLIESAGHVVGVLVVPNFGFPGDLVVGGAPIGKELLAVAQPSERGSCVFVVATDAPLSSVDLRRMGWRCFMGMARTGAISGQTSGDLAVAFTTAVSQQRQDRSLMNLLFRATVEASEEAVLDALFAARTTTGRDGHTMPSLPIPEVVRLLDKYRVHGLRSDAAQ